MTPVRITLFGPLTVVRDGASVAEGPGRRPEELLTYLLLSGLNSYDRRMLAQFFIPDAEEEQGLRLLRQHLHLLQIWLRGEAGLPDLIDVNRQQIIINRRGIWVDVLAAEQVSAVVQAHQHRYLPTCPVCLAQISTVLDMVTVPLPGTRSTTSSGLYREWYELRLGDARRVLMQLYELVTRDALRHGSYERGLQLARQLVQIDATDERLQRTYMSLLAASGRTAEALQQFETVRRQLTAQHNLAPEPATLLLAERIRAREYVPPRRAEESEALPELIGREAELAQARDLILAGTQRLITVVGIGGVGKTLLAQTLAQQLVDDFEDGAVVVRLESVSDRAVMVEQIAAAVGCPLNVRQPALEQLVQFLGRRDLLLVLDNIEQIAAAAETLHELLQGTTGPVIIVTSRRPIGLLREALVRLGGLSLSDGTTPGAAEQLFLSLVQRYDRQRDWLADLPAIAAICRLCDGLPLAVALAAYRARSLAVTEVLAQISRDVGQLRGDLPELAPRRASVGVMLAESWATAQPAVRHVLAAAAVFLTPCSLDGLHAVARSVMAENVVRDALQDAQELGFIGFLPPARYRLHPLVHQFLTERTAEDPQLADTLRRAYADYLSDLLQGAGLNFVNATTLRWAAAQAELQGEAMAAWRILLETEQYTRLTATAYPLTLFAAAGGWAPRCDDLLAETLQRLAPDAPADCRLRLLAMRVYLFIAHQDARRIEPVLDQLLQEPLPQPMRAEHALGLRQRGALASTRGQYDAADVDLLRSRDFEPDPSLPMVMPSPDGSLGLNAIRRGEVELGERYVTAGLITARQLGDQRTELANLNNLGLALIQRKDYAAALVRFSESLEVARSIGDRSVQIVLIGNIGNVRVMLGTDLDRALIDLQAAVDLAREMGVRGHLRTYLASIGHVTFKAGRFPVAVTYLAEALLIDLELGAVPTTAERFVQLCEALQQLGRTTMLAALIEAGEAWWRTNAALTARAEQLIRTLGGTVPPPSVAPLDAARLRTLIELICPLPPR